VVLDQLVRQIAVDGGQLLGITDSCLTNTSTANLAAINRSTGATSQIASVGDSSTIVQFGTAADPATHNVFINIAHNDPIMGGFISQFSSSTTKRRQCKTASNDTKPLSATLMRRPASRSGPRRQSQLIAEAQSLINNCPEGGEKVLTGDVVLSGAA
jgi:hypothetical protein